MEQPKWIEKPTPNLGKRKLKPTLIVLHHTGGSLAGDLATLTNPATKVSADFLVAKNGAIYKLNPQLTQYITWHAGESEWKGKQNCNNYSFGIEMEHRLDESWTDKQVKACAELCKWLRNRYGYMNIVSHADIARPRGRKIDPECFAWERFWRILLIGE
jgi:N-acetylmuramoyl-L-alanine amidase